MTVKKTDAKAASTVKEVAVVKGVTVDEAIQKATDDPHGNRPEKRSEMDALLLNSSKRVTEGEEVTWKSVVKVGGKQMAPVLTGLKSYDRRSFQLGNNEIYIPYEFYFAPQFRVKPNEHEDDDLFGPESTYTPPLVDVYVLGSGETRCILLLDDNSAVYTADLNCLQRCKKPIIALLINATSQDDTFIGNNTLINVDTSECLINDSSLLATKDRQGRRQPWETQSPIFGPNSKQQRYFGVRTKGSTIVNATLAEGDYARCRISGSDVKSGNLLVKLIDCNLANSSVEGGKISLRNVTLLNSQLRSEGGMKIHNYLTQLKDTNWRFPGIYLTNKFGWMVIDVVNLRGSTVEVMRSSEKEIVIKSGASEEKIDITVDTYTLEPAVRKLLGYEPEIRQGFGFAPAYGRSQSETIESSIVRYVSDTIRSRIEMINLLDQVVRNARLVSSGGHKSSHENMYAES